jgi:hypothetical protein
VKSTVCNVCGCEDHSKDLGCCDVCRRYGRGDKQPCECYDCGVSDGKRNDNSATGMTTYISQTLKELLDSFMKLLDRNDRTNFKRHKIDAMISSESRNDAKFKYTDCFVGETGKVVKCCFSGFLKFYSMSKRTFFRRVAEIKVGMFDNNVVSTFFRSKEDAYYHEQRLRIMHNIELTPAERSSVRRSDGKTSSGICPLLTRLISLSIDAKRKFTRSNSRLILSGTDAFEEVLLFTNSFNLLN